MHDKTMSDLAELARLLDVPLAQVVPEWSVGEVSERTGLGIDTLRYYERLGLIEPVSRTAGGRRVYSDLDIERIRFVRRLRATGMPVETVAEYVRLRAQGPSTARQRLDLLREHREIVERQRAELAQNVAAVDAKIAYYVHLIGGETPAAGEATT
ncbi:DNA-binding transcriptional regulator, MerR family [Propionibacterium cyclohexanicum]|uniref:DNA-binding transcriptional regulator, MerR family n=1 Tax=Propionibacterium cyclohexanicum TaxID=64702 RepID=A0A1H9SQG5_9ACTN|nr:DNA-binding transcriptional regulator, MerR family [Propionibacterium cyclohexanicum]